MGVGNTSKPAESLTVPPIAGPPGPSLEALDQSARRLPAPTQYRQGHQPGPMSLPQNILAFYRDHPLAASSCHHRHLLLMNLGVESLFALDGQPLDMLPGTAVLAFPYQHHHYPDPARQVSPRRLFFTFEMPDDTLLAPLRQRLVTLSPEAIALAMRVCDLMPADAAATPGVHQRNRLSLTLATLLECLLEQARPSSSPRPVNPATASANESRKLLQAMGRYLHEHRHRQVSIDMLADELAISPSHLRHLFKKEMGISLGHYIRQSRCIRAAGMLDASSLTLSQVARKCGFPTLSSFSRSFTRAMGVSPSLYRQRER